MFQEIGYPGWALEARDVSIEVQAIDRLHLEGDVIVDDFSEGRYHALILLPQSTPRTRG